jgi:hypothetical protein
LRRCITVEVRLVIREIPAALQRQRRSSGRSANTLSTPLSGFFSTAAFNSTLRHRRSAHLRALLFQNRFARKLNAVAINSQHFHEYLIALFQLVANIFNPMLRNFADMQQAVSARNDFDKRTELS